MQAFANKALTISDRLVNDAHVFSFKAFGHNHEWSSKELDMTLTTYRHGALT
jgi:hypothetical protein